MGNDPLARLQDLSPSYREVGATGTGLPEGYTHVGRNQVIGAGRDTFDAAAGCLMTWEMHRRAGFRITASAPRAAPGVNVLVQLGPSWLAIDAPSRVLHAVEEPDRIGFTYGTLDGHPLQGEESFNVLLDGDDVRFVVIAFSRPAKLITRLTGPFGTLAQRKILDRYERAIQTATA